MSGGAKTRVGTGMCAAGRPETHQWDRSEAGFGSQAPSDLRAGAAVARLGGQLLDGSALPLPQAGFSPL